MAVENGDLGMLKSLGIKDSELGDVKFFLEKLVNTGFLDWEAFKNGDNDDADDAENDVDAVASPYYYAVPLSPQFYSYLGSAAVDGYNY